MIKRFYFLLVLMTCSIASAWADEVTEKQAQEYAQVFLEKHLAASGAKSTPKLIPLKGPVCGLYVFNVDKDGGFIIVSNESKTTHILGFADSGNIDLENIPDNMHAWLQGYANEIAWFQNQKDYNTESMSKAKTRTCSHSTTDISPLMSTKWDQGNPYNLYCPLVSDGYDIVTGCVATAMAQVMYYTEIKAGNATTKTTAEIPKYKWNENYWGPIPAESAINWGQMATTYTGDETEQNTSAVAVATLMKYCGYSVEMSYGSTSSAYLYKVVDALRNYFGYSEKTIRYIKRSQYTFSNWVDLIYNELSQQRPVLLGAQAADNGHAFVCDGYKCENNIDLFHINWGWSGQSDGYFVLSVLNPDDQGAGGSATNSAYTFGHEAIVGIQKSNNTGTVLDVSTVNSVNLTINSVIPSYNSIALGESVNVTIDVSNNSLDAYDGEICLYVNKKRNIGKIIEIAAQSKNNCVITYTPSDAGTYTLKVGYPNVDGNYSTDEGKTATLTVVNQTPINLTATNITPTTATIDWENVGNASKWNLRSRPVTAIIEDFNAFDINNYTNEWRRAKWSEYGDWRLSPNGGINNSKCFVSPSFENSDLDPTVGLVTPSFSFGGSFSFYAWGEGEKFQIYILINGSNYYTPLSQEFTANSVETQYSIDLGEYAGQSGRLAIIHQNSSGHTSNSFLYVDDVTFTESVGEWTLNSNVTKPYNLKGLTQNTTNEVQTQAVNNDGGNWSTSFFLNTPSGIVLDDAEDNTELISSQESKPVDVYLTNRTFYKDGKWNTICLPFDVTEISESPLAGAEVRTLINASITGEKDGPTLNLTFDNPVTTLTAGTPYIIKWTKAEGYDQADEETRDLKNPVFNGVTINKSMNDFIEGNVTFKGTYVPISFNTTNKSVLFIGADNKIYYPENGARINACRAYFSINSSATVRGFNLNFGDDEQTTGIISIDSGQWSMVNGLSDIWYSLDGRKLSSKPTIKGVYIRNGNKVVIK